MAGRIMQTLPNMGRSLLMVRVIPNEEEGRRCLMMEQEEKGLKSADEGAPGAIDITAINSPVSAHSSGYSSADDENLISPNNSSQFSPFSPDEDFAGISFDAGFSDMVATSDALVQNHSGLSGAHMKDAPVAFPTLSMSPMHNPNFEELIDVDSIFDPIPNFANMPPNNSQSLLTVSSSAASCAPATTSSLISTSMATSQPLSVAVSPKATSPLATSVTNGVNMNSNFDNDIEMMDTTTGDATSMDTGVANVATSVASAPSPSLSSSPATTTSDSSPAMSNITINLPPGFNTKGQDGKSVLLDVLRKADKSQLLKIHEQINAAMASISQSKSKGKSVPTPELQISITPASTKSQFNIKTSTSIPKNIPSPNHMNNQSACQSPHAASSPIFSIINNTKNGATKATNGVNTSSAAHQGGGLVGGCANGLGSRASTPMDIAGTNLDNLSNFFSDLDSQIPQGFDLGLDSTPTNENGFSDGLLNDVNLGVTVPMMMSPQNSSTSTHVSKVVESQSSRVSSHASTGTPLVIATAKPTVSKSKSFNGTYAQQQQAKALSPISPNKCLLQRQTNGLSQQQKFVSYHGQSSISSPDQSFDLAAAMRGLDDHSYTSKCPSQRKNNEHVKFAPLAETKAGRMKNAPVLEHLLTTKKPLNPMKGSDHVAQGLQQLALNDMEARNGLNQPNLLKKLLTGEMDKNQMQRSPNSSIYTRRGGNHHISVASIPSASRSSSAAGASSSSAISSSAAAGSQAQLTSPSQQQNATTRTTAQSRNLGNSTGITLDTDFGFDEATVLGSLDLLGADGGVEMDSLWSTTPKDSSSGWNTSAKSENEEIFGDIDELLQGETQSEIDDILRQETRHEDEWMKQFLDGLL